MVKIYKNSSMYLLLISYHFCKLKKPLNFMLIHQHENSLSCIISKFLLPTFIYPPSKTKTKKMLVLTLGSLWVVPLACLNHLLSVSLSTMKLLITQSSSFFKLMFVTSNTKSVTLNENKEYSP